VSDAGSPGSAASDGPQRHGGNLAAAAARLQCRPDQLLDASASLVPFHSPGSLRRALHQACRPQGLRPYPDRGYMALRQVIAGVHGLDPAWVLPGNGAAELFTWAARDATALGTSQLPAPGFADYQRALACWGGKVLLSALPLAWDTAGASPWPLAASSEAAALWITNPHNPTGQLWSRASLEPLLQRYALVICDEAFLPLVPGGEAQSLLPLLADHPNLVVIRSLTKLFAIAGLRLGYALGAPGRLARWSAWRDPWPVNGLAAAAGEALLADREAYGRWCARVQRWVAHEGTWLQQQLATLPWLIPMPSVANYLLIRGERQGRPVSLEPLRLGLEQRHRILVRDCRSFEGLGESWLRLGLQDRVGNGRIVSALARELSR
jgi:histidinol-phosphate/aromatic aminotransferase/cobyric acid decarboxylase-like protein